MSCARWIATLRGKTEIVDVTETGGTDGGVDVPSDGVMTSDVDDAAKNELNSHATTPVDG